ncbi:transposase [Streptomyces sp. NPDC057617]|uniref:transposase n=1 Tax=Streptomyces sp. NPDC057617 TaxID=3346184 RepID=UPI0036C87898
MVCRDRDSGYSRAIKEAAPDATEVADRWHMLQNLSAAIERTCHQHRACLHKYALDDVDAPPSATAPPTALLPLAPPLDNIPATPLMQRVTDRHAEIHRLREATWTISAIARRFGLDRKTVRRYLTTDLDVLIASARDRRPRQLDPYRPYIQQRFTDGCTNAAQLYREIHEHGYRGNHQAVRLYIRSMRGGTAAAEPPRPIPTPRKITSWIMRPRDGLSREEQDQLDEVRIACPDIATAWRPPGPPGGPRAGPRPMGLRTGHGSVAVPGKRVRDGHVAPVGVHRGRRVLVLEPQLPRHTDLVQPHAVLRAVSGVR